MGIISFLLVHLCCFTSYYEPYVCSRTFKNILKKKILTFQWQQSRSISRHSPAVKQQQFNKYSLLCLCRSLQCSFLIACPISTPSLSHKGISHVIWMELTPLYLKGLLSSLSQFGPSKIQFGATNTNLTFLVVTLKTNLKETKAILIMVLCSNQIYPKILPFHHAISTQIIKYFTFFSRLNLDQLHFKSSTATCGQWLPYRTV